MTQSTSFFLPRTGLGSSQTRERNPFKYTHPLQDGRALLSFSYTTLLCVFLHDGLDCDLKLLLLIHPIGASLVATNSYTLGLSCSAGAVTG